MADTNTPSLTFSSPRKLADMAGVRGGDCYYPVQLCRDDETGRFIVRRVQEGGFACVDIDLADLWCWLVEATGASDWRGVETALTAGEHSR